MQWCGEVTKSSPRKTRESWFSGTPLGHVDFVQKHLQAKLDFHQILLDRIPSVPDWQSAWLILLLCSSTRANFLLKSLPQQATREFAFQHDSSLCRCLSVGGRCSCGHLGSRQSFGCRSSAVGGSISLLPAMFAGEAVHSIPVPTTAQHVLWREAGGTVSTNIRIQDMDFVGGLGRRVASVPRTAVAHTSVARSRWRQERRYHPEFSGHQSRARLVVLAAEVGGQMVHETVWFFLLQLAKAKSVKSRR